MRYSIEATPAFVAEAKRLSKKYFSLKEDIELLSSELLKNPEMGVPLGKDFYKIRIAIASKGKGKSGGARVISCVKLIRNTIYLAAIYDKSEKENISDKDLKQLANQLK